MKIEIVIGDYKIFLDKIFENLKNSGFDLDEFKELDHIAYRTESIEGYEKIKKELLDFFEVFSEKIFGGRLILVGKLKEALVYENFSISAIELMAPKESNSYKEGLEHAEFVIKTTLPEFLKKHGDINFKMDAYGREENPELVIAFENCAVKFHEQSLLAVRGI